MVKALGKHLEKIKASQQGIFIPYIMAGDHEAGLDGLFETIDFLAEAGVSAIEIGLPFSDPVADGPVIEVAGLRSLAKGVTLKALIQTLQKKESPVPLVIMSYFNPIFQYGIKRFVEDLAGTSVEGLIIPDLPYEHQDMVKPTLASTDISLIPLVSLLTPLEDQKKVLAEAEGFVYAVAVNGVTGQVDTYSQGLDQHLAQLTDLAELPVLTGFGVSSQADVERFNRVSDGVIVGSKIVQALHDGQQEQVVAFISKAVRVRK